MNVQSVMETKQRILTKIQTQGPSYPAKLARELGLAPLFISAFMSELVNEQKLTMSTMKIGSSPLYVTPGQELLLENFVMYLGSKEREAFLKLKQAQVLNDQEQDPAIRIALQAIKDFAMSFTHIKENQPTKYWRYFTLPESQAKILLEPVKKQKELVQVAKSQVPPSLPTQTTVTKSETTMPEQLSIQKPGKKREMKESAFLKKVQEHFTQKEAQLDNIQSPRAKEYHATLTISTPLGQQRYLAIIKEKKKLTEEDVALALHKAQTEKMPALLISPGTPDKTAQLTLDMWKDLIRVEKID